MRVNFSLAFVVLVETRLRNGTSLSQLKCRLFFSFFFSPMVVETYIYMELVWVGKDPKEQPGLVRNVYGSELELDEL